MSKSSKILQRAWVQMQRRAHRVRTWWGDQEDKRRGRDRHRIGLEPLESRILLAASPLQFDAQPDEAIYATLRLDEVDGISTLRLIDDLDADPILQVIAEKPLADTSQVIVTGGGQDDRLTIDASVPVSMSVMFDGGAGSDTLVGSEADHTWVISGTDSGDVGQTQFSDVENLTGGASDDVFLFSGGAGLSGTIMGGGGTNTLDFSAYTAAVTVNLATGAATGTAGFSHVQHVTGGADTDTLVGADVDSTWIITEADAGTVEGTTFSGVENLTGGQGSDTFVFAGGGVSGIIDGGGGANVLDYSAQVTGVTVDLGAGSATATGGIVGVNHVTGGLGSDTVIGPATEATWMVTGPGTGSVSGVTFNSIENLTGAAQTDTFVVAAGGGIDGWVDGGGGTDTLIGPPSDTTWNIDGTNSGHAAGVSFVNVENLTGAADNEDTFVFFETGSLTGLIDGGDAGFDTIVLDGGTYSNITYTATGPFSGSIQRDSDIIHYDGLEPLVSNTVQADTVDLVFNNTPQTITIRDSGTPGDGQITAVSTEGENPVFANPTVSLTITAGSGADTIVLEALDSGFNADLIINAGGGSDEVRLNAVTGSGDITVHTNAGDDIIKVNALGAGDVQVNAGAGEDSVEINVVGANLTVDGEGDTDTIAFTSDSPITLSNTALNTATLASIERAVIESGVAQSATFATGFTGQLLFLTGVPEWTDQGPGPATDNGNVSLPGGPAAGAIQAAATHPTDANIIYAGTVNGGVWKTENALNATNGLDDDKDGTIDELDEVRWTPLTDQFPSLAISSLTLDVDDPTNNTIYAGTGSTSSFGSEGGRAIGILKSTNGGDTWELIGSKASELRDKLVTGIFARGDRMVVVTDAGLFYSPDGGQNFSRRLREFDTFTLANGGQGYAVDEVISFEFASGTFAPVKFKVTAITSSGGVNGIVQSLDLVDRGAFLNPLPSGLLVQTAGSSGTGLGVNFTHRVIGGRPIGSATDLVSEKKADGTYRLYAALPGQGVFKSEDAGLRWTDVTSDLPAALVTASDRVRVAVTPDGSRPVYAALVDDGDITGIFKSTDQGGSWTPLDPAPSSLSGSAQKHLSFVAHPTNDSFLFVGGKSLPANDSAPIYRWNGSQWQLIVKSGTVDNTGPHPDSRNMVFDAQGNLLEMDDGGINKLEQPGGSNLNWVSLNGDLRVFEFTDVAYDAVNNVILGAAQDNAVVIQTDEGALLWNTVASGDGEFVSAFPNGGNSQVSYYFSSQFFGEFTRTFDTSSTDPDTEVFGEIEVNGTGIFDDDNIEDVDPTVRFEAGENASKNAFVVNGFDPFAFLIGTEVIYEEDPDVLIPERGSDISVRNGDTDLVIFGDSRIDWRARVGVVQAITYGGDSASEQRVAIVAVRDVTAPRTGVIETKGTRQATGGLLVRLGSADDGFNFVRTERAEVDVKTTTDGAAGVNEVQQVTVDAAVGGTFTLSFMGVATAAIPFDAPAGAVETALEGLAGLTDVTVSKAVSDVDADGVDESRYTITFNNPGASNVAELTANAGMLDDTSFADAAGSAYPVDMVSHPDDWKQVFVLDSRGDVWHSRLTTTGSSPKSSITFAPWVKITAGGNLSELTRPTLLQSMEIVVVDNQLDGDATNDEVAILLGGEDGVFRVNVKLDQLDPDVDARLKFHSFGQGLPNIVVKDLEYDATDDVLIAGTLGRGAWTLTDVLDTLKTQSVLRITGTAGADEIVLKRQGDQPWLLDVFLSGGGGALSANPTGTFDLSSLERIEIDGKAAGDTVRLDGTNGAVSVPGGVHVVDTGGGVGDILKIENHVNELPTPTTGRAEGVQIQTLTPGSAAGGGTDEVQEVKVEAVEGTFTLSFGAQTTTPVRFDASAMDVKAALVALPGITQVDVALAMPIADVDGDTLRERTYTVTFRNPGSSDVAQLTADDSKLVLYKVKADDPLGSDSLLRVFVENVEDTPYVLRSGAVPPVGETNLLGHPVEAELLGGLEDLFVLSRDLLETSAGTELAVFEIGSLGPALNGQIIPAGVRFNADIVRGTQVVPDGSVQADLGLSVLDRVFEDALDGQTLAEALAGGPQAFKAVLEAVDPSGSVVLTRLDGTPFQPGDTFQDGVIFDVELTKEIGGVVDIGVAGDALIAQLGSPIVADAVDIDGLAEITTDVTLDLIFGVDADGFFIQPDAAAAELSIGDFELDGDLDVSGRFGFLGVDLSEISMTVDDAVKLRFDLTNPATGGTDKIRLADLGNSVTDLVSFQLDSPGSNDVQFNAKLSALAVVPGLDPFSLFDTDISLDWADIGSREFELSTSNDASQDGSSFLNFIKLDPQALLDQFENLKQQLAQVSLQVDIDIPFIEEGFDGLVKLVDTFDTRILAALTRFGPGDGSIASFGHRRRSLLVGLVSSPLGRAGSRRPAAGVQKRAGRAGRSPVLGSTRPPAS